MSNEKSWFRRHWLLTGILGLTILIIGVGVLSGLSGNIPTSNANSPNSSAPASSSSNNPQPTTVTTIGTVYMLGKSWDADPEVDGLEFYLAPKDKDDSLVKADGTISIKLWKMVQVNFEYKCLKRAEDLLDSWNNIVVSHNDYSIILGATVRAEYKNYDPTSDEYVFGCAEITFTTSDGKNFISLDDSIFINKAFV
jgi:hypothetical protein